MKVTNLNWLLTATVVFLVTLLVYLQYVGVSRRTVAIIAAAAFFTISCSYIFAKRHLLFKKQGIPQQATNWKRLAFFTVVGLAVWIAMILQYIRP